MSTTILAGGEPDSTNFAVMAGALCRTPLRRFLDDEAQWQRDWRSIREAQDRIAAGTGTQTANFMTEDECGDDGPSDLLNPLHAPASLFGRRPVAPHVPLVPFNAVMIGNSAAPRRQWIVDGWLPVGRVTLLYGDGGTGKTTAAQQLMTACQTGASWFGIDVAQCATVALLCEDDAAEIHWRQEQINAKLGIEMSDLGVTHWLPGIGADNVLMTFDRAGVGSTTERFAELRRIAMETGARLVVIDASASTFGGLENDRPQVSKFVGHALTRLAMDIGGAVLLLAHPSKSGMAAGGSKDSGSTAWNNACRSRWSFVRPVVDGVEDEDARVLTREKSNWSRRGDTIKVRWRNGVFVADGQFGEPTCGIVQSTAQDTFLAILRRCDDAGITVSMSPSAGNYGPKMFAKRPDAHGVNKKQFETAMYALQAADKLHVVAYGRPSNPCSKLALKPAKAAPKTEADADRNGA
jgi:RecA-family ATPase